MSRKKSLLVLPHLVDAGGALDKDWYVEYSCRDPRTGKMKRFRDYSGFKKLVTEKERREHAAIIIQSIKDRLEKGWTPFEQEKTTYQDELLNQAYADRWGRERESLPTIRLYLSEFLEFKRASVTHKSYQTYCSKLRIFAEWAEAHNLNSIHISFITRDHIIDFMRHIVECNNISRLTVEKYAQILHAFFEYLLKSKEILTENPATNIPRMGALVDKAPSPIPERDRKILLSYMAEKDPQLWLVCLFEYYCAIRPNELRQLKIGSIDLERQEIRVPCTISKNRKTEIVSIPNQLHNVLKSLGVDKMPSDLYLFSDNGNPGTKMVGKNTFCNHFVRIRKKLGLPSTYKLYSFKHSGGVELVNAGVDTWQLQRHFRHKSIETTENYIRKNFATKSEIIKEHFPDI